MADSRGLGLAGKQKCRPSLQSRHILNDLPQPRFNHVTRPRLNLPGANRAIVKELLASIPVPAKVVRHFAAITLAITACIALFADGERREAIGAEIKADRQRQELRTLDAERNGPQKIGAKQEFNRGNGFGIETTGTSEESSLDPAASSEPAMGSQQYRPQGQDTSMMPPGYFNPGIGMPEAPQVAPIRPKPPKKVTPADIDRLMRFGEERAGPATQAGN
ncbi:hypothetical protein [Novosphingobium aquae]|uniref:Uncharacterized protein n=1 Tax=Novosphingobium aquae TaxID=3133435 RepID=A0ABU8S5W6_9SPHN